jgi:hypothetical protein
MVIEGKEKRLVNASIYLKNAILELKAIPCECNKGDYCNRCCLIDDVKNIKSDVEKALQEII